MTKLKMLVLTVIAAMAVGAGALTAAPSASAAPPSCSEIIRLANNAEDIYLLLFYAGYGHTHTAESYRLDAKDYRASLRRLGC
jgi:hypothetical protein